MLTEETLADLPEELIAELRISKDGNLKENVMVVVKEHCASHDVPISIDEVLVAYWYRFSEVIKRKAMLSALNDLVKAHKLRRAGRGSYAVPVVPVVAQVAGPTPPTEVVINGHVK